MQSQTFWQWKLPSASYRIHYIEKGTGPRHVLLLHGFAAHSYTWKSIIENLAQAGYLLYFVWRKTIKQTIQVIFAGIAQRAWELERNPTKFLQWKQIVVLNRTV
jgi:hypothetical protein